MRAVEAGYAVCFTYASQHERATRTAEALRAAGGDALAVQADVADPDACATVFSEAEATLGPVTALVNNAGVTGRPGPFHETTLADVRRVFDVNVVGAFVVSSTASGRGWAGMRRARW